MEEYIIIDENIKKLAFNHIQSFSALKKHIENYSIDNAFDEDFAVSCSFTIVILKRNQCFEPMFPTSNSIIEMMITKPDEIDKIRKQNNSILSELIDAIKCIDDVLSMPLCSPPLTRMLQKMRSDYWEKKESLQKKIKATEEFCDCLNNPKAYIEKFNKEHKRETTVKNTSSGCLGVILLCIVITLVLL